MSRHPASPSDKIPVTRRMKRQTARGAKRRSATARFRARTGGVTSASPWAPSKGIYMDLKIPTVAK